MEIANIAYRFVAPFKILTCRNFIIQFVFFILREFDYGIRIAVGMDLRCIAMIFFLLVIANPFSNL